MKNGYWYAGVLAASVSMVASCGGGSSPSDDGGSHAFDGSYTVTATSTTPQDNTGDTCENASGSMTVANSAIAGSVRGSLSGDTYTMIGSVTSDGSVSAGIASGGTEVVTYGGQFNGGDVVGSWTGRTGCRGTWGAVASGTTGGGGGSNNVLRKEIPLSFGSQNSNYSFGTAYVLRRSSSSTSAYLVVPVTNLSAQTQCFIKFESMGYRDSAGNVLTTNSVLNVSYVSGGVQVVGQSVYTDTCLKAGEAGYVLDIDSNSSKNLYDRIASLRVASVSQTASAISEPVGRLEEQSGSIYSASSVTVTAKNVGSQTLESTGFSEYLLKDSNGIPAIWGFFLSNIAPVSVPAGSSVTLRDPSNFGGAVSAGMTFLDYDVPSARPAVGAAVQHAVMARYQYPSDEAYDQALSEAQAAIEYENQVMAESGGY